MALTAEEIRERQGYLGSSDAAAILGFDPYRSAYDVWLEKTQRVVPEEATEPSREADFGNRVEGVLVKWAVDQLGGPECAYNERVTHPEHPFLSAQCDGLLRLYGPDGHPTGEVEPVEAKAWGLSNPRFDISEWGEEGSDQVPFRLLAQVNHQLLVTGAPQGHIAALLGGGLFLRYYCVPRNQALIDRIEEAAVKFWQEHVQADVPPNYGEPPRLDTLERVRREPAKGVSVDDDYAFAWQDAQQMESEGKKAKEDLKRRIMRDMGDAEIAWTPFGSWTYQPNRSGKRTFRFHASAQQ